MLDPKLIFETHIKTIIAIVIKTIGLLRKFQRALPRLSLVIMHKSFVRRHLDYGNVIFDQAFKNCIHQQFETIQQSAALAIMRAIRGSSKEKLYQELGFGFLQSGR